MVRKVARGIGVLRFSVDFSGLNSCLGPENWFIHNGIVNLW